jgi:hypothetical protein
VNLVVHNLLAGSLGPFLDCVVLLHGSYVAAYEIKVSGYDIHELRGW